MTCVTFTPAIPISRNPTEFDPIPRTRATSADRNLARVGGSVIFTTGLAGRSSTKTRPPRLRRTAAICRPRPKTCCNSRWEMLTGWENRMVMLCPTAAPYPPASQAVERSPSKANAGWFQGIGANAEP